MSNSSSAASYKELRVQGNEYYSKRQYPAALHCYDEALRLEPSALIIYLNKAAVLLEMEEYYKAYQAAQLAYNNKVGEEKALFRLAKAAYGMRDWETVISHLQAMCTQFPSNKQAISEMSKAKTRLAECRTGNYNLLQMYKEAVVDNRRYLDVADYKGPVQVGEVEGKGKGLLAARFVGQGTLLLVSKAFSIAYKTDARDSQTENVVRTKLVLGRNPQWTTDFYSLYAGCDDRREEACTPGLSNDSRIESICRLNSFETQHAFDITKVSEDLATGLWTLPSFLNHSCVPNACRIFYADVMMVFAIADIQQGEEITHSYIDPFTPYPQRLAYFRRNNFECACRLCAQDANDSHYHHRFQLQQKCLSIQQTPHQQIKTIGSILEEIRQSYVDRQDLRLQMYGPSLQLFNAYKEIFEIEKAVGVLLELVECLEKSVMCTIGTPILLDIAQCYIYLQNLNAAQKYAVQAMQLLKIRIGAEKELFGEIFPEIIDILK